MLNVPRYFLNIRDPDMGLIGDPDGEEAEDIDAVRRIVAETVRDILARPEAYGTNEVWNQRSIEVIDETDRVVLIMGFAASRR